MNKISGFTEEEAKSFVNYVNEGLSAGNTLSNIFASYAKLTGRAKGSVINYYYLLLHNIDDERVKNILRGTKLEEKAHKLKKSRETKK